MASKALFSFFLIFSSFLNLCFCDNNPGSLDQLLPGLGSVAVLQDANCMQKLLPCQQFLKTPENPPPSCCMPLSNMVTSETDCLCSFVNNPKLLQSFNVSKDDLLKLPKACGVNVDISKCNSGATSSSSSSAAAAAGSGAGEASSAPEGDDVTPEEEEAAAEDYSTSSTKKITPYFGVPSFVALLSALVFSAY